MVFRRTISGVTAKAFKFQQSSQMSMSKSNQSRDIPAKNQKFTQEEIDASMNEAMEKGELELVDILGNREQYTKESEILYELLTGKENPLPLERILPVLKHLQGQVLTIIDATFVEKDRAKYVKDIIKDAFSQQSNWIYELSIREFKKVK